MRIVELEPQFLRIEADALAERQSRGDTGYARAAGLWTHVDRIDEADGIMFLCPKCFAANGGCVGTHQIICWRPRVPQDVPPVPGRWEFEGTGYEDLTLVAGSSSVLLTSGCQAHFFVRGGEIVGC